jgi:hypothetical protein
MCHNKWVFYSVKLIMFIKQFMTTGISHIHNYGDWKLHKFTHKNQLGKIMGIAEF